jgi:hypothetical protein
MPQTAIGTDVDEALYVHHNFTAESTLNSVIRFDLSSQLVDVLFRERMNSRIGIDPGLFEYLPGRCQADAIYICQANLDPLVSRQIYACYSSHDTSLTLSLFVTGVLADHSDNATTADDLAVLTALFDG